MCVCALKWGEREGLKRKQVDVRDAFEGSGPYGGNNPNSSITAIIDNYFQFNISSMVHKGYYHDADQIMMGNHGGGIGGGVGGRDE